METKERIEQLEERVVYLEKVVEELMNGGTGALSEYSKHQLLKQKPTRK